MRKIDCIRRQPLFRPFSRNFTASNEAIVGIMIMLCVLVFNYEKVRKEIGIQNDNIVGRHAGHNSIRFAFCLSLATMGFRDAVIFNGFFPQIFYLHVFPEEKMHAHPRTLQFVWHGSCGRPLPIPGQDAEACESGWVTRHSSYRASARPHSRPEAGNCCNISWECRGRSIECSFHVLIRTWGICR